MSTAKKKATSPIAGAIDTAAEQFESAAAVVKGGVDAAIDAGAEQSRAAYAFEGVEFVGRENLDAAQKASEAYFASLKDMTDLMFKSAKDAGRYNADAAKKLSSCKTPEDFTQTQMKIATDGFENAMAAFNGFSKAASKAAGDVTGPLSEQFGQSPFNMGPFDMQPFAQQMQAFWTKPAA